MMRVVPQADDGFIDVVLVPQNAEAGGTQQQIPADGWLASEPPGGEHTQEVAARKNQHVGSDGSHPAQRPVCARRDLLWRFASWTAVAKQVPVRPLGVDVGRA